MNYYRFILFFIAFIFTTSGIAQNTLEDAIRLSQHGAFSEADQIFEKIEETQGPVHEDITIARAYNYSWWGKTKMANLLFQSLLESNRSTDALLGLGYSLYFNQEHAKALPLFKEVIQTEQNNISAWEGIFHTSKQLDKIGLAHRAIDHLLILAPDNVNFHFLKGELAYSNQQYSQAKRALSHASSLNPKHTGAQWLLKQLSQQHHRLELGILTGLSDADGESKVGVRRIDFFYRNHRKNLVFGFYDNSLSFENIELVQFDKRAPQVGLGNSYTWNKYFNSTLSVAKRFISGKDENMVRFEQNIYPTSTMRLQAGVAYHSLSDNQNNMVYSLGLEQRLTEIFSLEVQYFRTQNSAIDQTSNRYIISPKVRLSNEVFLTTIGYFTLEQFEGEKNNGARGLMSQIQFPVTKHLSGRFIFHYQREGLTNIQSAALGANYSF